MPGILDALTDTEFRRQMGIGVSDAANRGAVAGTFGSPVDMATTLANLLIAGGGYAGHKMGLLGEPPELIDPRDVPMSSEWIGQKMQNSGFVSEMRNPVAEALASLAIPIAMQKAGVLLYNAETKAIANASQPRSSGSMASQYGRVRAASAAPGTRHATKKDLERASARAALPIEDGGLGLPPGNTREDRMKALGYKGGYYRGGEAPVNGQPAGPWYTSIQGEAKDYAQRTNATDVRE